MSDDPVDRMRGLRRAGRARLPPAAVHFKGSGFYTTDYANKGRREPQRRGSTSDTAFEGGLEELRLEVGLQGRRLESRDSLEVGQLELRLQLQLVLFYCFFDA